MRAQPKSSRPGLILILITIFLYSMAAEKQGINNELTRLSDYLTQTHGIVCSQNDLEELYEELYKLQLGLDATAAEIDRHTRRIVDAYKNDCVAMRLR